MKASIDIGSNSILLLAGEYEDGRFIESINIARVTGLGKGIDKTGELSPEGIKRALEALTEYKEKLSLFGISPHETLVTATEASRVAKNFSEFSLNVKNKLGFRIHLLNAEGEAYFCARGVNFGDDTILEDSVVLDLGGASTELIKFSSKPFTFKQYVSLPVGSVRATDWMEEGSFEKNIELIFKNFEIDDFKNNEVIGVAGTITTLAAMMLDISSYADKKVMGKMFEINLFEEFIERLEEMSLAEISKRYPVAGKRVSTIVGGSKVTLAICKKLEMKKLFISTYGLRFGIIIEEEINQKFLQVEN
ncbi:MAG: hypothetical protein DRQ88_03025 [Epsilonproteobacteria bacterium]|nr:MAG: hypothetical protein DRQ89_01980 [Campylobacterota bacterium]RLA67445.1 MAG: hypothetical protein DRQ88_03025 [Campylobacterota bacterium]